MTQLGKTLLVVNPFAGGGRTQKLWPHIADYVRSLGLVFDVAETAQRGHATRLAAEAMQAGYRLIVSVGGDGTANEIANGLAAAQGRFAPGVVLGLVPTGSGADFIKTFDLPRDWQAACQRLLGDTTRTLDLGSLTYRGETGDEQRYFINVAGLGFDGAVTERSNRKPKNLGGTVTYLSNLVLTLSSYQNKDVDLQLDDLHQQGRMNSVIVCNGRWFGGGMYICPDAQPDDGIFDVVIIADVGRLELLRAVPSVYGGTHVTHPKIHFFKAQAVELKAQQEMWLQADGESLGRAPAGFRLIGGGFQLKV